MNDAKTMGSLEEKLMSYVSTTPQQDANYDIALAMLTHYGKLKNLSLAEIADLCYVSKASISRFCRFMGFDGFRSAYCRIFLSERIIPGPFTTNCVPTRRQPCRITARK